ncbi:MAG: ParB/RepB/Spo0J family partition protein [Oscillospiraceae bacterium]|nr:ParB/RepB/Spo0J family partition protein [Oscillospiraceae bacterium]
MKTRSGQKIKMATLEELMGIPGEESASEVDISLIHGFKNHPFKVVDDDKMEELVQSIRRNGVLSPVILRPADNNTYEMISGHRRMHAAKQAGLSLVPAFIRDMTDDESTIFMVDSNIQREELLPSEKAFAYRMKLEAMKRQGKREDLKEGSTSTQNGWKSETAELIGKQVGESKNQVRRYIRLTELTPDLLDMVDRKRLNFTIAVDISYIDKQVQKWLYEYIRENGFIKPNQITALRKYISQNETIMTQQLMISILNSVIPVKAPARKVTFNESKLLKYFPADYSTKEMEQVIFSLLDQWKKDKEAEK